MNLLAALFLILNSPAMAHVPALLLPLKGSPISSYFIGQSDVSRAVFSELTAADDFFVAHLDVKSGSEVLLQMLTPRCEEIPQYELYQPSVLVIKGDLPWKKNSESNRQYLARLEALSVVKVASDYKQGKRPQFFEEHAKHTYWVGGEWRGTLPEGLYSLVVFSPGSYKGNFSLGINEKEAWTPDLFAYVEEVLPAINKGFCSPRGFTGNLTL